MINPFETRSDIEHLPPNISEAFEEVGLVSTDTASLLASKAKMLSSGSQSKYNYSADTLKVSSSVAPENSLSLADLTNTDTFSITKSSVEELKASKPPLSARIQKKHAHCNTCKCMEISTSAISSIRLKETESLQYLSKLESIPPTRIVGKALQNKPYTSPIYKLPSSPSQVFRQRINTHILQMKSFKQNSEGNIFAKAKGTNYLF